jgi:gas vesicle protein
MPHELPVNWTEIEKACIAGVPQRQVAKDVAAKTAGAVTVDQLYKAIRKRASREQWAIPASIMRRARTVALVAAGEAATAKAAATWRKGESGRTQGGAMLATLGIEHQERKAAELLNAGDASPNEIGKQEQGQIGGAAGAGLLVGGVAGGLIGERGALQSAPVTATELVTRSLAERGQSGLSLALDAALASLASLDPATPVPIRSMTDLLTAVKATKEAAGLDKPATAVQVNINGNANATIETWESLESA